jgi:ribosomal protein S18 acetylase RimI-like enzyme
MSQTGGAREITVRTMGPSDLEPMRWVVYRAYYEILLSLYGPETALQYELRSPDFMAMYLRREPQGCFVAESIDHTVAGGLFCFVWGEVGWFGSLAVAPEWQGQGIGQRLTRRAIEYLRGRGCRQVGLETWPSASLTRHMYTKLGFETARRTVKLLRPASTPPLAADWACRWVQVGDVAALSTALEAVNHITQSLSSAGGPHAPAIDYRAEVRVPVASGWAELAILEDRSGEPVAFGLCYVKKPSGKPVEALDIRLLAVAPGRWATRALDALLAACARRAIELGCSSLTCDVNLCHERAVSLLRARGFRPVYELIRMEIPVAGIDIRARNDLINCARWAG